MRKMSKLRQKLQISHSDVIRALRYLNRSLDFVWQALVDWLRGEGLGKLCVLLAGIFLKKCVSFARWWLSCICNKYNMGDSFLKLIEVNLLWVSACNVYLLNLATLNNSFVHIKNVHNVFLASFLHDANHLLYLWHICSTTLGFSIYVGVELELLSKNSGAALP